MDETTTKEGGGKYVHRFGQPSWILLTLIWLGATLWIWFFFPAEDQLVELEGPLRFFGPASLLRASWTAVLSGAAVALGLGATRLHAWKRDRVKQGLPLTVRSDSTNGPDALLVGRRKRVLAYTAVVFMVAGAHVLVRFHRNQAFRIRYYQLRQDWAWSDETRQHFYRRWDEEWQERLARYKARVDENLFFAPDYLSAMQQYVDGFKKNLKAIDPRIRAIWDAAESGEFGDTLTDDALERLQERLDDAESK